MRRKERAKRFLALLLAFTMIFTSSSMNVLAATIVGGYKNSNKQTEAGDDTQAETQAAETNEDGSEVRQNTVTFATDGHAHIVINGATVDSTANAKDGKIVFDVVVENGYAVESVLVDKSIPARTQGDGSYIIEGIQTNETTVDVTTAAVETEAQETTVESESEIETETETESESETEIETETNLEKPAQKLTVTAADGARIIVNAPEGALPEGSSVRAEVIESKAIETVLENTVESSGKELSSYKAYDITIIGPDGMAIQPDERVKVSIRNANVDGEENAVYHVDGASADKIADIANGNHASFEAEHFSIYVITGENTPAIATYEFYADGVKINSQSIKNDEMLIEPAAPEFEGKYFSGWFEEGSTTALSFHSPVTVTTTRTIRVTAKYNPALYVFFTNEAGVVIRTKNGTAGTDISTSDVIFPVSATQGITGWYTDTALTNKVDTVRLEDKDVILYPKVEEGYHITYMGEGGSYTAPVFVLPTDNTVAPKAPTRPGYLFKYWSTTQNGPKYQFGTKITSDITLHAVWEAKDTTYLVMYWQENANYNNAYLDESKRDKEQYSYAASETKKGKTGEQTKVSGWKETVPAGFTLKTIEQQTIAGDGSTVVNVYLDRKTYTVKFMKREGYNWKEDEALRITAKYGADVSSKWPGKVWSVTKKGGPYQSNLMIMERDMMFYYAGNGNDEKADYYIQTLPGESGITVSGITYKLDHTDVAAGNGYIVTDEDRYAMNGFTINIKDSTKNGKPYKNAKFYYTRNKYLIAFINGGHTVETLEKYYEELLTGVTCSQKLTPPAGKESYQFAGWYDNPEGEGREYSFDGRMMPANGITVYAKWVAPTFNITVHHTLDASDAPTIITKKLGEKISEDDLQVTVPDGYSFRGWYLYENGQRTQAYNTNTEIHGNITLVPYWTSNAAFRVTYSAGEGTGEVTDTLSYAEDAQAELKSAGDLTAPAGKPHFQGWKSSVNNAIYYPGDTCVIKGDVTFTAQWGEEKKATLTYRPGNGDGTETSYTVDNNAEITAKSVEELGFSKAGYTFIGWNYTNAEGKAAVAKAGDKLHVDVNTPGNLITAQWAKLNADGGIWPYDGKQHTVSNVSVDGIEGYSISYKVDGTEYNDAKDVSITNAGTKKVTVIARKAGYAELTKEVTLQITPLEVTVTVVGKHDTREYNGTVQSVNGYLISTTNGLYHIDKNVNGPTQAAAVASRKDVGTTYMELSSEKFTNINPNFDVTFDVTDGYIIITEKKISDESMKVTDPSDLPYNGKEQKWIPTVEDTVTNANLQETVDYTVSYDKSDFTNVTGKITVTITGTGNYTGTVTKTYQITPAPIKITTESGSKVYDGTPLTAPGKIDGLVDGEEVSFTVTGSQTNVGSSLNSYTLKWDKTAKESNYRKEADALGTLTVTAQSIVPDPDNPESYKGVVINDPVDVPYDGQEHKWSPTVTDKENNPLTVGTDYTVSYDKEDFTNVTGKITVTITGIGNYTGTVTKTYQIIPASIKITTESDSKVYDGTPLTAPGKIYGLVDGEEVSFTVTGSQTNVGSSLNSYTLKWDKTAKESNYRKEADALGTLTVTAQSIVPDPDNPESYKGVVINDPVDVPYDGQEHKWSPTVTDKENNPLTVGTDYTVSYDKEDFTNVTGKITVTITGTGNYTGEVTRTYQITPKNVTVTTDSDSKAYDGKPLTAGGKVEGIVEGETYGFTITGSQTLVGSSDNTYELTWAEEAVAVTDHDESVPYTAKKSNYTVTDNIGILTVTDGTPEIPLNPDLVVRKEDDKDEGYQYKLGEVVTFKISVTNIYATEQTVQITELEGVKINDGTNIYEQTGVQPGQTIEVTATYTITEADIAAGFFKNIVKVKFSGGKEFENEKTVTTEEAKRSYTLIKMADESTHESGMFKVGETIHYTITVTNTGNQTLKNLQITDTLKAAGTISNIKADGVTYTQNGGTTIFTVEEVPAKAYNEEKATPVVIEYDYLVQEADKGNTISNAAVGKDSEDPEKPGEGDETNTQIENPKLTVTKTVEAITGSDGKEKDVNGKASLNDVITYKVTVKNTGNVTLKNAKISDSLEGIVLADNQKLEIGDLAVGEEKSVVYTYKVKEKDLGSSVVNKATATADVPEDPEETPKPKDDDEKEVPTDEKNAALRVTKTVTSKGSTITVDGKDVNGYRAGDIIEFNILVENTGNLTLTNVVVNDVPTLTTGSPKGNIEIEPSKDRTYIVDGSKATIAVLEPDTEVAIRATYQVMPGDGTAQGNGLSNAAFVTGTSPDENNPQPTDSSKTEPIPIEPEPDDGKASLEGSITVTKRITTSDGETPEDGVDAMIKVGLYDNASFSGQPIKTNTITISRGTSGNTVFDELDSTAGTVYYVAELDENGKPIIGDGAHLTGYGAPVYSANCKAGINPTTTKDTAASITNPLEAEEIEDDEKTSDTSKSTTSGSNKTTTSTKAAKTGDNTNMMIYWMLLGIAVLAGGVAVIYRKRKER